MENETAEIQVGPVKVKLIAENDRIVGSLVKKPFEPDSLARWAKFCEGGGTVIDVGAYTGLFTVAARLLGCHVIAFEPMPSNRLRLRENCRINNVSDAVSSEAIADRCGDGGLHYNPIPYTSGASLVRKKGPVWPVDLVTLDSLELRKVKAIKIDVERAEPMVLRGARDLLLRCRPFLLVEVLGEKEGEAVLDAMDGLNYRHESTLDIRNWVMMPDEGAEGWQL